MANVYIDEAGQEEESPVTIECGVIIYPNSQWRVAQEALNELVQQLVPEPLRPGFYFHTKQLWSSRDHRDIWPDEARHSFIYEVMALPRSLQLPIAMGMVRRNAFPPPGKYGRIKGIEGKLSPPFFQQMIAFSFCVGRADEFMRCFAPDDDLLTVVVEDIKKGREFLRHAVDSIRRNPMIITPEMVAPREDQKEFPHYKNPAPLEITKVIDSVHFVPKKSAPLLQLADARAFGFRRFLAGQEYGKNCVDAILGESYDARDWSGDASSGLWPFLTFDGG